MRKATLCGVLAKSAKSPNPFGPSDFANSWGRTRTVDPGIMRTVGQSEGKTKLWHRHAMVQHNGVQSVGMFGANSGAKDRREHRTSALMNRAPPLPSPDAA